MEIVKNEGGNYTIIVWSDSEEKLMDIVQTYVEWNKLYYPARKAILNPVRDKELIDAMPVISFVNEKNPAPNDS